MSQHDVTNPPPDPQLLAAAGVQGQKYAYATASLMMGIICYTGLLGLEKAALALLFGWLALRSPGARLRREFAFAGIALGALSIVILIVVFIWKWDELLRFYQYMAKFD